MIEVFTGCSIPLPPHDAHDSSKTVVEHRDHTQISHSTSTTSLGIGCTKSRRSRGGRDRNKNIAVNKIGALPPPPLAGGAPANGNMDAPITARTSV